GHAGYVSIHIDQEGDYGFALPMDIEFHILMGEDGHDDHDEGLCHDTTTHENYDLNETDCENAGHVWMEGDEEDDGHDDDHDDESNNTIVAEDDEDISYDPHSWLDPLAFEAQLNIVLEKLILTFPDGTSNFTTNANSYKVQLQTLDDGYEDAFGVSGTCFVGGHEKTIVANHNAYSYIANRYDIEIITVHGIDPEGEPSPQDIIRVTEHIDEKGITILFVEEFTSQNAVNSIVEDTGVSIEILYTMEMAPSDSNDNYISMMAKNLNNLVNGIGC
ncbi:MAG: metal ABC transporter substrate-binding protein, partial [Candidatus Poseidoniales archaeon]